MAKASKSKKTILLAGAVLLALGLAGGGTWYYRSTRTVDPLTLYQTVAAQVADVSRTVTGEAHLQAPHTASLFLEAPQTVVLVHVEEGDWVEEGDTLVTYSVERDQAELTRRISEANLYLDNAALTMENIARPADGNTLLQHQSAITTAEQSIRDIKGEIESLKVRIRKQAISVDNLRRVARSSQEDWWEGEIEAKDFDADDTNYRMALAELDDLQVQLEAKEASLDSYQTLLKAAKKKLENAENPLDDASTTARYEIQQNLAAIQALSLVDLQEDMAKLTDKTVSPMAGYVASVGAVEGGVAGTASPVVEIAEAAGAVARFEASEFDAPAIALGQRANVWAVGTPEQVYTGVVSKISAHAFQKEDSDDDEVIVPVEIALDRWDDSLKVGYTVGVELLIAQKQGVVSVPIQSVFLEEEESFVYVIAQGEVARRKVETGFSGDSLVEVAQGLAEGELLVLNPGDVADYGSGKR